LVIDRATFDEPYQRSAGIEYTLVNGEFVVRDHELVQGSYPGKRIQRFPPQAKASGLMHLDHQ